MVGLTASSPLADVRAAMLKKLALSGLDVVDAKKLKMVPHMNGTATALTGFDTPGFQISYFNIEGKATKFWRYRRFVKDSTSQKKVIKYVQPKGSGVFVYFPPLVNWTEYADDTTKSIIITEGELKAACATKLGFPTLGLGGVWSFKSKKQGKEMIDDLAQINWGGRKVFLCFDSDAMTNSMVMQSECDLAKQLFNHGARVYVVRLPSITKDGKTGLDDYLMHKQGGVERYKTLLLKSEEWSKSAALHEFNAEVILIKDPGVCVIRATGQRVDARSLISPIYSNRLYMKPTPTDKDPLKRTESSVPVEWLKWSGRAEAKSMTYEPGQPEVTATGEYNMWKGWGSKPIRGPVGPWTTLLDYIFKDAPREDRVWFERWCAYPIIHPGAKMFTSVVIWSTEQGTGKSLVAYTLGRIYGKNYCEIGDSDLDSAFNSYMVNKQFVVGDEITGNGGGEKRQIANKLKSMITQQQVTVNQKYVPNYEIPDCVNYLWTSNHCDAFFMENADRRYFVIEIKGKPLASEWYRNTYDTWYKSAKGINALHYHLLHLELADFDHRAPARMTDAKKTMIEEGRSDLADWVENISTMYGAKKLMTSEELLLAAYGQGKSTWSKNGLTRAMHSAGYVRPLGNTQQLVLPDGRQVRPWLTDRSITMPGKPSQQYLRDLWAVDRSPANPTLQPKFSAARAKTKKKKPRKSRAAVK